MLRYYGYSSSTEGSFGQATCSVPASAGACPSPSQLPEFPGDARPASVRSRYGGRRGSCDAEVPARAVSARPAAHVARVGASVSFQEEVAGGLIEVAASVAAAAATSTSEVEAAAAEADSDAGAASEALTKAEVKDLQNK